MKQLLQPKTKKNLSNSSRFKLIGIKMSPVAVVVTGL